MSNLVQAFKSRDIQVTKCQALDLLDALPGVTGRPVNMAYRQAVEQAFKGRDTMQAWEMFASIERRLKKK